MGRQRAGYTCAESPPWWRLHGYSGEVDTERYCPGDVVYFPAGPFGGICAVVREVDGRRARLRLDFSEGVVHREGNVLRARVHSVTVGFDEIELM